MATTSVAVAPHEVVVESERDNRVLLAGAVNEDVMIKPPPVAASLSSCISNLANTILGAGMLGLPHAFAMAGFIPGTLMLILFGGFSSLGLFLLTQAADRSGRPATFYAVAEVALPGRSLGLAIDLAIGIKCFGVATSYLIVIGDSMPKAMEAFGASGFVLERRLWTVGAAILVAPLTYCKRVDALKFTSAIALACVLFVVLLVFLFATRVSPDFQSCNPSPPMLPPMLPPLPPLSPPKPPSAPPLPPVSPPCRLPTVEAAPILDVLRAVPIFVFSYTCHQNIVSITNELHQPTRARTGLVILASVLGALSIYLLISVSGYITFGPVVAPDVLATYPSGALVAVARIAISLVVTFSYPLQSHPSRGCILSLIAAARRRHGRSTNTPAVRAPAGAALVAQPSGPHGGGAPPTPASSSGDSGPSTSLHIGVTTAFLLLSTAIALAVDDLGVVLSIVGATGSTIVSYILPGATYFLLCRDGAARNLGLLQLVLGVIIMLLSLTLIAVSKLAH